MSIPTEAMHYYIQARKVYKETANDLKDYEMRLARCEHNLDVSFSHRNKLIDALKQFKQSIHINFTLQKLMKDVNFNFYFSVSCMCVGDCLLHINQPNVAMKYYKQAMDFHSQDLTSAALNEDYIIKLLFKMARCSKELAKFEPALLYIQEALQLQENVSPGIRSGSVYAKTFQIKGSSLLHLGKRKEALKLWHKSLQILKDTENFEKKFRLLFAKLAYAWLVLINYPKQ